jgi:hypothetical protein
MKTLAEMVRVATQDGRLIVESLVYILADPSAPASDRLYAAQILRRIGWGEEDREVDGG